jgi:dipeptide/tripeptide permease
MTAQNPACSPVKEDKEKLLPGSHVKKKRKCCPKVFPGPPQVKYIIYNELCERFSYYGLRAILIKFLQDELEFGEDDAAAISLFFSALCYTTPLVGGFIADSYLGKYCTILLFSTIYVCGGGLLALSAEMDSPITSFVGLGLIGIGTGGIKPCVSSFGADQFSKNSSKGEGSRNPEMESYFMAFYFSINFGSIGSFLVIPIVREHYGYFWAFLIPAICLFVALVIFVSATKKYVMIPPAGSVLKVLCGVCCEASRKSRSRLTINEDDTAEVLFQDSNADLLDTSQDILSITTDAVSDKDTKTCFCLGKDGSRADKKKIRFLDRAVEKYSRKVVYDVRAVWELVPIFLCFPCFWALFDQQANTWEQQAELMDTWKFQPDQMSFWNPLLVLTLIPFFDKLVYPCWAKCQPSVTALHKMVVGMIFTIASYILSAFVQIRVEKYPGKVSVFWQLPQYILISVGEILISITGLEFAYTQAPISMKAFIASFNLSMVAIGDILAGIIYTAVRVLKRPAMFFLFAGLMGGNLLIFIFFALRYNFKVFAVDEYRKRTNRLLEESKKRGRSASYAFANNGSNAADMSIHGSLYDVPDTFHSENNFVQKKSYNVMESIRSDDVSHPIAGNPNRTGSIDIKNK